MTTCNRCGRPVSASPWCDIEECYPGEPACDVATAAFQRGAAWALDVAKAKAMIVGPECDRHIGWTDVDAEIARGMR